MITSLQVEVLGEDHETESCGRLRFNDTRGSVFVVEKDKEIQEWREQKMNQALPGFSGGKLRGTSKAKKAGKRMMKRRRTKKGK